MAIWEYGTIRWGAFTDENGAVDYRYIFEAALAIQSNKNRRELLNRVGREGWNVAAFLTDSEEILLKRRIKD